MNLDLGAIISKSNNYKRILENTLKYREDWKATIKPMLKETLEYILKETELKAQIKEQNNIENLEAIVLDLGKSSSGISESLEDTGIKRTMVKTNGGLVYQQLFNGKIMIMALSPHIEGYGEARPPRTLEILRPDELKQPFIVRHFESMLKDITDWEDFDDDQPQKSNIGFTPIGYINGEENNAKS